MSLFALTPYLILFFIVLPLTLFLSANRFVRQAILQAVYILVIEKIFGPPRSFPQPGKRALKDVTDKRWLTRAMQNLFPGTQVQSATGVSMGSDMGNASTMFRLTLKYDENPHDLPESMIVKLVKNDFANRIAFTVTRMNEMESLFYANGLGNEYRDFGLFVPRGFGGGYTKLGGHSYTLMEDITGSEQQARFTREDEPITKMNEAKRIVRTIAKMHAPFFDNRERLDGDLSWIIRANDPVLCMTKTFFDAGWKTFQERLKGRIPDEVIERGYLLSGVIQQLYDYMSLPPLTVAHGDCHLENSYFVGKTGELGFYDMQLLRICKGAMDLATFMGGSFTGDLLSGGPMNNDGEMVLLSTYLEALEEHVGRPLVYQDPFGQSKTYDLNALLVDYKMALAMNFGLNVAAVMAVPLDTSAAADYFHYVIRLSESVHRTSSINFALWYLSTPGVCDVLALRGGDPKLGSDQIAPVQRAIPGRATNVEYNVSLHEAQISPEEPQGFIDKYIKRPLKYKIVYRGASSRKGYHGQKTTDVEHHVLEGHHGVDYARGTEMENHAFDSYYLSAFSPDCPSVALRWCRRTHADDGELWLAVKLSGDDESIWTIPIHPETTCDCVEKDENTILVKLKDGSQMAFECLEPMKTWRATFKGRLCNKQTDEVVNASFSLLTESCMDHFAFSSHVSPHLVAEALSHEKLSKELFDELKASHQEHYEQFCFVNGQLKLGDRSFDISAKGMRDRAFGVREWGYMQRYIASYFWAGPMKGGASVAMVMASLPTMTAGKFGYVCAQDGDQTFPIDAMSGRLSQICNDGTPPQEWEVAWRAGGKYYLCRGFALPEDSIGLNMKSAMWIHLRFATFEFSVLDPETLDVKIMKGHGASEFGYRLHGYEPKRPKSALAAPVHGKMA